VTYRQIQSFWPSSETTGFAVGNSSIILEVNGETWMHAPGGYGDNLHDIWYAGPNDVFAVGDFGAVLRYEGGEWHMMDTPTQEHLFGVHGTAPDSVYAVGTNGAALFFDGVSWETVPTATTQGLYAVWAVSASRVYAAGAGGYLAQYDGASWAKIPSGTTSEFRDIWRTEDNIYAVGRSTTVLRYDGTSWKLVCLAPGVCSGSGGFVFRFVRGTGPNDVYVGGEYFGFANSTVRGSKTGVADGGGYIFHYDGSSWEEIYSNLTQDVQSLWIDGSDLWATGFFGYLMKDDGAGFQPVWQFDTRVTTSSLFGIDGYSGGDLHVVGDNGTILRYGK